MFDNFINQRPRNKRKLHLLSSAYQTSVTQAGVTLVELVIFIVIMGVALAGVLKVLEITSRNSADPLVRKQALSIAESLLLEIQQQSFTFCDPEDANASSATSNAGCASQTQDSDPAGLGAITGPFPSTESRYSNIDPFDNVADYGGFTMPNAQCAGICIPGDPTPITGLDAYAASVTITRAGNVLGLNNDAALRINVSVTGPANTVVTLSGYRVRYAPNI
ncbi:MAG: type II secretion system protein [Methylotenera sp.]|uniref:type IV pilus modification PilV family protein n=1 Tax=Methylotenera sp. TaxID=2051956 RepID=UPI00271F68CE|nr:type II secretion system protein [Methylotenera sp.]MDO9150390.1 type II secretion system protein [Methylotenera sp.]